MIQSLAVSLLMHLAFVRRQICLAYLAMRYAWRESDAQTVLNEIANKMYWLKRHGQTIRSWEKLTWEGGAA